MPENQGTTNPTPLSDGGAELVQELNTPLSRLPTVYGSMFLLMALIGVCGLVLAYVPPLTLSLPTINVASAAKADDPFDALSLGARAAYVYDARNDRELFAKNANAQLPIASITKVMLVLVVAEVLAPDEIITISRAAVQRGGGGLTYGEEWKMRDLVDYTLITSSNTGAITLAEAADARLHTKYPDAPQGSAAIWRMNALAHSLGMDQTFYLNESGLDESTTQAGALSSARDLALLFDYIVRTNADLYSGTARSEVPLSAANFPERDAINTNNALSEIPGFIMGKTGTTDLAGGNLAIAFNILENHPIIIVVLGSTPDGRFDDVKKLVARTQKAFGNR